MFSRIKLSGKIVGTMVVVLALTSATTFLVIQHRINEQAEDAFRETLRQLTSMASTAQNWSSENLDTQKYADNTGMVFRTPSLHPRKPKNLADDFERRALESFQKDPSLKEYSERVAVNGKESMLYAQPVRITEDCLPCHGDPIGEKDPFGYAKEGVKVGDLHGIFAVTAPTDKLISRAASNSLAIFLLSLLTLIASGAAVYVLVQKLVIRPLSKSIALSNSIAANDLSEDDLIVDSADEIGQATVALNAMKNSLRSMVQSIASTAESVAGASEQISATASEQLRSAETEMSQVLQIATAMHEMTSTVVEVSDNSNRAAAAAHESAEMAHSGGAIVENTLQTMNMISEAVSSTGKRVDELGKRSHEIGRIAAVIDDIADQTNLLALNAAIEAARAGEQGRGFAVVADEVRKLAERTATATKEIAQMIEAIQAETKSASLAMDAGTRQVNQGVSATSQAGEALRQIICKSEEVGGMITMIATASTEQSSTTEAVNSNVERISKIVKASTVGSQRAAKACQDLSRLTRDLQGLVERFQLGEAYQGRSASAPRHPPLSGQPRTAPGGADCLQ